MGVLERMNNAIQSKKVSSVTFLLVGVFGIGSWVAINGLWVELPILVSKVPEGWALPSYLTIIIQIANIGPILYTLGNRFKPKYVYEIPAVYVIVGIGAAASALLGFFWDETSVVTGRLHSTALLVLSFFLAAVDCTSSVVFLPYMALFRKEYMSALFVGEGMSGLLPSLVALGQGIGGGGGGSYCSNSTNSSNTTQASSTEEDAGPNFSANVFFFFLCGMMVVCGLAFVCLNHLPTCKREHVNDAEKKYEHQKLSAPKSEENIDLELQETKPFNVPVVGEVSPNHKSRTIYLLVIQAWINALANGVIPSLQSYACLPYSYQAYHLTVTLSNIINPVACLVFHMIPISSVLLITIGALLYTGMCSYVVVFAAMSPAPPLVGTLTGEVLMVLMCVLSVATVTYVKVSIASVMREEGQKQLLWCGISMQVGSCIGALTVFPLVNIYNFFTQPQSNSC